MAKEIRISDDDGSTWHVLPGSTGEFSPEGETIEDTIFGYNYQSQLTGLISWTLSANAMYKGFAGYHAQLLRNDTATSVTGEPMSNTSGQIYQVDDGAKNIWDRSGVVTVYDDGTDATDNVEWIDFLTGRIKFVESYSVTGSVTADFTYYSTKVFGKANSFTLTMSTETNDTSTYDKAQDNGGFRTYDPGLKTVELELGGIFDADENAKDILKQRNEIIVSIDPVGDGETLIRGFFRVVSTPQSGDVGALEEQTINLTLNVPQQDKMYGAFSAAFAPDTSLNVATQKIFQAWLDEEKIKVQYLPSGTTGNSPLDGVEGQAVMTDVSLSGGLSDMNTFTADMQGDGAWTEV